MKPAGGLSSGWLYLVQKALTGFKNPSLQFYNCVRQDSEILLA